MIQEKILQSSEILEEKFHVSPKKSKLYLHANIEEFVSGTRGYHAQSIFLPKNLEAHAPDNRIDLAMHEYHGHGLYCEQTHYGERMVEDEKTTESMSAHERESCLQMHEFFRPTFEGHALFTEDLLLRALGEESVLEKRIEELRHLEFNSAVCPDLRTYFDVYEEIKKTEEEIGVYDLWYRFGFPRQFDQPTLEAIAKEKLGPRFNNLIFVVQFGSANPRGDIDLCAVLADKTNLDVHIPSRTIDLCEYEYTDFVQRMRLLDVPITQPMLTGTFVCGDESEFERLRLKLQKQNPTKEVHKYLTNKAEECFERADVLSINKKDEEDTLVRVLINLTYATSYAAFAERYAQASHAITLNEINNPLFEEVRGYLKATEQGTKKLDGKTVSFFVNKVKGYLKGK